MVIHKSIFEYSKIHFVEPACVSERQLLQFKVSACECVRPDLSGT